MDRFIKEKSYNLELKNTENLGLLGSILQKVTLAVRVEIAEIKLKFLKRGV